MLACGMTVAEALAAGMARTGSPSEGRDVGVVYNLPRRDGPTILPASGDVGAQYTPAAGWAQAICFRQGVLGEADWQGALSVAMGGEGSAASNGFWAALNIATAVCLPMLFFIEDNAFGLSVPGQIQTPGGNIAANLTCFADLKVLDGDGSDPEDAWHKISQAVEHVRLGQGACLLRLSVPRLAGHTFIDDQAYKSPEQRRADLGRDPLPRLRQYLHLDDSTWDHMAQGVQDELAEALQVAESSPTPIPDDTLMHRFFQGSPPLQGGLRPEGAMISIGPDSPQPAGPRINLIDAVRCTLEHEMRINPRLAVFGEDVGVKGGVHGATLDMQKHFGPERVFDTSLSEDGIIGRAVGMALAGLLPVPEIQFRKYADPAHEQISDLGTLRWRTAGKFAAPVVVRVPVGFGKKTGDPWHSVTGEATYAHMVGWRIAFPSNAEDAVGLFRTALRGDDPTFFFEHRLLLDTPEARRPYPGDDYCLPFGRLARLTEGDELSVITWGAMVYRCLEAAQAYPGRVEVIDLRTIIPWDQAAVLDSVKKTGKVLVVHEDSLTGGFAGEISAVIAERAFSDLDAPIARLAMPDIPVPFNLGAMEALLPSVVSIRNKIEELLAF
jgi:2-oxoisovalerate dehydrogenase E1 component